MKVVRQRGSPSTEFLREGMVRLAVADVEGLSRRQK